MIDSWHSNKRLAMVAVVSVLLMMFFYQSSVGFKHVCKTLNDTLQNIASRDATEIGTHNQRQNIASQSNTAQKTNLIGTLKLVQHNTLLSKTGQKTAEVATPKQAEEITYQNLPKITLVTRTCNKAKFRKEFYCMYLRSVVLFWPGSYGGMSIVLDRESKEDETWGTTLKKQMKEHFPYIPFSVYYEPLPNNTSILKNPAKSYGYNRQLWSTFFADLYTESPIIAYIDTDSQFVTPMTKEYLYNGGKLKVFGEGSRQSWVASWEISTLKALGLPQVANFMVTFPTLIYKDTVINARKHIMKHLKTDNFEEAFRRFYVKSTISPVDIWMTYAWFHEHDRYDWHIKATEAKLKENNNRLPEGHKIGPRAIVPSIVGVGHISDQKVFKPELMIPGYCMSLKAIGGAVPAGCKNVTHDMALFCDYWESFWRYPWPAADKWCKAGKMAECCHEAMVDHYKDVAALAKEKNLKFSKDDVHLVDKLAIEMGVTCPKVDLP